MKAKTLIIGILFLLNISCKTNQTNMIVADKYDVTKNQTTLTILPYGNVIIPKEWKKTSYNQVSKQHFFQNNDLTTISIAKNLKEKYPFYKAEQNDEEFVSEFVKWDSEYWKNQGLEISTIENKAENTYIIWNAKNTNETKPEVNTFFLFGVKNNFVYGFSISSKVWNEEQKIDFLKNLYETN